MFEGPHVLQFPNLVFEKEVKFGSRNSSVYGSSRVYRLDWSQHEDTHKKDYEHWAKTSWAECELEYVPSIPEEYDIWVKGLRFAIPANYLREIRRCSWKAVEEGNHPYPFDTMIRDICCEIRNKYVYVGFKLLADCVYDELTNYFYRKVDQCLISPCLLLKFWNKGTGRGLIRDEDHAKIDSLEKSLKWRGERNMKDDEEAIKIIERFLKVLDEHAEIREKKSFSHQQQYAKIHKQPLTGPSLSEEETPI